MEPTPDPLNVGAAQIDITPAPGGELCGFAARLQPSLGVLDPLFARALFLTDGRARFLWVHCDLIGLDREIVDAFRARARQRWDLAEAEVMLSATHTHSGPGTIHLHGCGAFDQPYCAWLLDRLEAVSAKALRETQPGILVSASVELELAVDRRGQPSAHRDPRLSGLGFRRADGDFIAVVTNFPIHPVALGPGNRHLSGDLSGATASLLSRRLPGRPIVLATNGACGNLNPPAVGVSFAQVQQWADSLAAALAAPLLRATAGSSALLSIRITRVPLPLETLEPAEVAATARRALAHAPSLAEWGDAFRHAVAHWQHARTAESAPGAGPRFHEIELQLVHCGQVALLGVNAELFSRFATDLRCMTGRNVMVVGFANGVLGYVPTSAAYSEGGYEVDAAHFFYDSFRVARGGLELLASAAAALLRDSARRPDAPVAPLVSAIAGGRSP